MRNNLSWTHSWLFYVYTFFWLQRWKKSPFVTAHQYSPCSSRDDDLCCAEWKLTGALLSFSNFIFLERSHEAQKNKVELNMCALWRWWSKNVASALVYECGVTPARGWDGCFYSIQEKKGAMVHASFALLERALYTLFVFILFALHPKLILERLSCDCDVYNFCCFALPSHQRTRKWLPHCAKLLPPLFSFQERRKSVEGTSLSFFSSLIFFYSGIYYPWKKITEKKC